MWCVYCGHREGFGEFITQQGRDERSWTRSPRTDRSRRPQGGLLLDDVDRPQRTANNVGDQ
jgi:hypothetical protein